MEEASQGSIVPTPLITSEVLMDLESWGLMGEHHDMSRHSKRLAISGSTPLIAFCHLHPSRQTGHAFDVARRGSRSPMTEVHSGV